MTNAIILGLALFVAFIFGTCVGLLMAQASAAVRWFNLMSATMKEWRECLEGLERERLERETRDWPNEIEA